MLAIQTLGTPQIKINDAPVPGLSARAAQALFLYLVCNPGPHSREFLAELLWHERTTNQGLANLRTILTILRKILQKYLIVTRTTLEFDRNSNYWLDLEHFQENPDLIRGEFLQGFDLPEGRGYSEWVVVERERLRLSTRNVLLQRVDELGAQANYETAVDYAHRAALLDPFDEMSRCALIELFLRTGKRNAALRELADLRTLLANELNVNPTRKTEAFQVKAASLVFPPPAQIPSYPHPFIGRFKQLETLHCLLLSRSQNLITIIGQGGAGKTRFVVKALHQLVEKAQGCFLHGVFFVSLVHLENPSQIASQIASVIGFSFGGQQSPEHELFDYLREKELLLVLDNLEHLIAAKTGAEVHSLVTNLMANCPNLKLVTTSRERLNLTGERLIPLQGLEGPEHDQGDPRDSSATQLFIQAARRVYPGFSPSSEDIPYIIEIGSLAEGLPLVIELAAGSIRQFSCEQIARTLADQPETFTISLHDHPKRHRSLEEVFDQSWRLLVGEEKTALQGLTVFRGEFGMRAATAVLRANTHWANASELDLQEIVTRLLDKSLLQLSGPARFTLHPFIYSQATQKLDGEKENKRAFETAHTDYYLQQMDDLRNRYYRGEQVFALETTSATYANATQALKRAIVSLDTFPLAEQGWEMLYLFFWASNRFTEGREIFLELVKVVRETAPSESLLGQLLIGLCEFEIWLGEYQFAEKHILESIQLLKSEPNRLYGQALELAGRMHYYTGDLHKSQEYFLTCLAIFRKENFKAMEAQTLNDLGNVIADSKGQFDKSEEYFNEALLIYREMKDPHGVAKVILNMGAIALDRSEYAKARLLLEESLALYQEAKYAYGIWAAHSYLGTTDFRLKEYESALRHVQAALKIIRDSGNRNALINSLCQIATFHIEIGKEQDARTEVVEALHLALNLDEFHLAAKPFLLSARLAAGKKDYLFASLLLKYLKAQNPENLDILKQTDELLEEFRKQMTADEMSKVKDGLGLTSWKGIITAIEARL